MRLACRKNFVEFGLMKKISNDLSSLFKFDKINAKAPVNVGLWNIEDCVELGINYGGER